MAKRAIHYVVREGVSNGKDMNSKNKQMKVLSFKNQFLVLWISDGQKKLLCKC